MKLTKSERIIVANQLDVLARLAADPEIIAQYERQRQVIILGIESAYESSFTLCDPISADVSDEVEEILEMFRAIGDAETNLGRPVGIDEEALRFAGFDPIAEAEHASYADFVLSGGDRWLESRDRAHSRFPMLKTYRKMLRAWNRSRSKDTLTEADLRRIYGRRPGPVTTATVH
jgi:uncharacterized protein YfbU (UPF0304 family)